MLPDPLFLNVHMYGVMIGLGLLACFLVLFSFFKKKGIEQEFIDFVFYNGIVSIAVGFGAAALFQAFYNYLENPEAGFKLGGGITFIGGLLGGAACFLIVYFIFRNKYKSKLTDILSIVPSCILIAHGFGRIGCFFAGCCHGVETDSFLGVQFPHLDNPVHPTQLYEAAFLFIMFGVCSYLVLKKNFKHNMSLYLITYGVFRFLVEYIRGDERGKLLSIMSPSQFWSIVMIIGGVVLYFCFKKVLLAREGGEVVEAAVESGAETKESDNLVQAEVEPNLSEQTASIESSEKEVKPKKSKSKKSAPLVEENAPKEEGEGEDSK